MAAESDAAKLVILHHRRRGWAWVATGSMIGLAVYAGLDRNLFTRLTGPTETLSAITALLLLALALVGLVVAIIDSSRIHRADATAGVSAKDSVSHYPLYAYAYRYPPRHLGSWLACIFMLVAMAGITAYILPAEINSWAYAVGAENQGTFNPVSYSHCPNMRPAGCHVVTEGFLTNSDADVSWGSLVPLGKPFIVREPVWAWGTGRTLINADSSAVPNIVAGLFFDAVVLLLLYVLVVIVRETSPRRRQLTSVRAAGTSGGHHPDRSHHPSSPRRRAHGGQGKRSRRRVRTGR